MKKLLALILALTMVFALCACGQQSAPAEAPAEKIYQASFRVRSSIGKLKALKEFLVNGGYEYEQF